MNNAVFVGRFNLFTFAHISTSEAILEKYNNMVIAIITSSDKSSIEIPDIFKEFYYLADQNYIGAKTLKPANMRRQMVEVGIASAGLSSRVTTKMIRRPEYFIDEFNSKFPKATYDIVFPRSKNETGKFDLTRNDILPLILGRKATFIEPKLTMHSSQITQSGDTERFVPREVQEVIEFYEKKREEEKTRE